MLGDDITITGSADRNIMLGDNIDINENISSAIILGINASIVGDSSNNVVIGSGIERTGIQETYTADATIVADQEIALINLVGDAGNISWELDTGSGFVAQDDGDIDLGDDNRTIDGFSPALADGDVVRFTFDGFVVTTSAGMESIAIGASAQALGDNSTVVGFGSTSVGDDTAIFGDNSTVVGSNSIAIGLSNNIQGSLSGAVGLFNTIFSNGQVAAFGGLNFIGTEDSSAQNVTVVGGNNIVPGGSDRKDCVE